MGGGGMTSNALRGDVRVVMMRRWTRLPVVANGRAHVTRRRACRECRKWIANTVVALGARCRRVVAACGRCGEVLCDGGDVGVRDSEGAGVPGCLLNPERRVAGNDRPVIGAYPNLLAARGPTGMFSLREHLCDSPTSIAVLDRYCGSSTPRDTDR